MKIDKVIFSTSVEYSSFWNIQSQVFKEALGIEPICLLYGKRSDTTMHEKYGQVIEREFDESLPEVIQITWSKFDFPKTEEETTWMIGDIDMVPLNKQYFVDNIAEYEENAYLHLNFAGISKPRRGILDAFLREGSEAHARAAGSKGTGADLAGHYHVSKGKNFIRCFDLDRTINEQISFITESHKYGLGVAMGSEKLQPNPNSYYWCAEESYSSERIFDMIREQKLNFNGVCYDNVRQRVDRSTWNESTLDYKYSPDLLKQKQIVDIHCQRPYEKQEAAMMRVIELSGILG